MSKGKKKAKTTKYVKIEKMNWQIDKKRSMNFFIKKLQFFNLKNKNASLRAKVIQDKEKSDWLKSENRKLYARLKDSINAACIQSQKIEREIK